MAHAAPPARSLHKAAALLLAAVCAFPAALRASSGPPPQQRALLELVVNEVAKGQVYAVVRGDDVLVPVEALERGGLRGVSGRRERVADQWLVSLSSLAPDVSYRLDEAALALRLTVPPRLLGSVTIDMKRADRPTYRYARATSAFLNYGVNWTQQSGLSATTEAGLSVRGVLATTTATRNEDGSVVRGLSSAIIDDRRRLLRFVAGDTIVGDRLLGGTSFIGGVRVAREYSIDPYFVQFPMLGLSGAATTPSTVEVYVDNRLVRRERVQPGRFDLANVPVPGGASQTRLVIRDAFGQEQEIATPFYLSSNVLARGLHEYEYSLGFPRDNVGTRSAGYASLAALARHRYGFSDSLTAGFRTEAWAGLISGGPSLNIRLPMGEIEAAAAVSRWHGRSGGAAAFGYAYTAQRFTAGLNARAYSAAYGALSLRSTLDRLRSEVGASAGVHVRRGLSLNVQQTYSESHAGRRVRRSTVQVSSQVGRRIYAFASASAARTGAEPSKECSVGLSLVLGGHASATLSAAARDGRASSELQIQRPLPAGNGFGYRVGGGTGTSTSAGARVQLQNGVGRYEAGHETIDGVAAATASAAGGLVFIGGGVHATRPVQDGFALIRVPGVGGVRGLLSNQVIGRTNARGDLLVPNLLPYYANRLGISDEDVPLDHTVLGTEQVVATPYRGGAVVVFGTEMADGVAGKVVVEGARKVIPEYGELTVLVGSRKVESPIGRDGSFYLEGLPTGRHRGRVRYLGTSCTITLDVPPRTAAVTNVGLVWCTAEDR